MRSIKEKKNKDLIAAFRLFVRTLHIHFALLGRKRKYIKSKTTAKLKEKRTSIAVVQGILRMFDTFGLEFTPQSAFTAFRALLSSLNQTILPSDLVRCDSPPCR